MTTKSGAAQAVPHLIHQPTTPGPPPVAFHFRRPIMSWTDGRIQQLKTLWAEGHSASAIADQLGHLTRNAVIGKVQRLGLSGRPKTQRPGQARRSKAHRTPRRRAILVSRVQREVIVED